MICWNFIRTLSITRMTKRNKIIIGVGAALICLIGLCWLPGKESDDNRQPVAQVAPFEVDGGWGYKIILDGQPFIYQNIIPGVPGKHVFKTRESAVKVGQRVAEKIVHNEMPSISREELLAMHITDFQ